MPGAYKFLPIMVLINLFLVSSFYLSPVFTPCQMLALLEVLPIDR